MEDSDSSKSLENFLFSKHYLSSLINFDISFLDEAPGVGFHQISLPLEIYNFLNFYFTEVCTQIDTVVTPADIETSRYSKLFRGIFYYFWKCVLRFQEIYWARNFEFNISPELFFSNKDTDLNRNSASNKAFILINLSQTELVLNSDFILNPKSLAVSLNTPRSYFNFTDQIPYLFIPLF